MLCFLIFMMVFIHLYFLINLREQSAFFWRRANKNAHHLFSCKNFKIAQFSFHLTILLPFVLLYHIKPKGKKIMKVVVLMWENVCSIISSRGRKTFAKHCIMFNKIRMNPLSKYWHLLAPLLCRHSFTLWIWNLISNIMLTLTYATLQQVAIYNVVHQKLYKVFASSIKFKTPSSWATVK